MKIGLTTTHQKRRGKKSNCALVQHLHLYFQTLHINLLNFLSVLLFYILSSTGISIHSIPVQSHIIISESIKSRQLAIREDEVNYCNNYVKFLPSFENIDSISHCCC